MAKQYKSLAEVETAIQVFIDNDWDVPESLLQQREVFAKAYNDDEYIYNTLKENSDFPVGEEKDRCIRTTVSKLLEDCKNAKDPVLLLGKIQCGKTDTFENIIGLSFDKGIDVCIVFTKGTKALVEQTINRMAKDYRHFEDQGRNDQKATIHIFDIIKDFSHNGLRESIFNRKGTKVVIVCKKEATNMMHLINLFNERSPYLKEKKVLVVDDEADFCSRNYVKRGEEVELAKISKQIVEFTGIPEYCRYLQVTATPYALYLQPDGTIELGDNGTAIPTFKPRYTTLVPVHDAYVGGKQYFVDSEREESMYSHIYHCVQPKCIEVMGKRDKRYEKSGIASKNIQGLTNAIVAYIMAAAIRSLQSEKENIDYRSSALFHVDHDKDSHEWQETLVKRIVQQLGDELTINHTVTDERVKEYIRILQEDYLKSNAKGRAEGLKIPEFPAQRDITKRMRELFVRKEINIQVINSDNDVQSKLDKKGQLKLESTCNIFIGGSILDRGITISNMLCFFYGRDPKNFQMDTVLQHCRMYGARSMADMAVTRLHTTTNIYRAFKTMNQLDDQLRMWFVKHNDVQSRGDESNAVFVGYDSNIKPCAPGKIRVSNVINIKPKARFLPIGFQTGPKSKIATTVNKIREMIETSPYYENKDANGIFEIPVALVREIIPLIRSTYIYGDELNCLNAGLEWDVNDMLGTLQYAVEQTDCVNMYCMHRTDRDMGRYTADGRFIDAPDNGSTDITPARNKAVDRPLIMFFQQNGQEEKGWRGTPFYWPVLVVQQNIDSVIYSLNVKKNDTGEIVDASDLISGIDPEKILRLTLRSDFFWDFISGAKDCEYRDITETTASRYLLHDYSTPSKYAIAEGVDASKIFSIHTAYEDAFPFVLRDYSHILFRTSRDKSGSLLLVKINDPIEYYCSALPDEDIIIDRDLSETEYKNDDRLTQYSLCFNCEVVDFRLNKKDQAYYDAMKAAEE